jgi:hypothetical protein
VVACLCENSCDGWLSVITSSNHTLRCGGREPEQRRALLRAWGSYCTLHQHNIPHKYQAIHV